jgi:hypothetical protein
VPSIAVLLDWFVRPFGATIPIGLLSRVSMALRVMSRRTHLSFRTSTHDQQVFREGGVLSNGSTEGSEQLSRELYLADSLPFGICMPRAEKLLGCKWYEYVDVQIDHS